MKGMHVWSAFIGFEKKKSRKCNIHMCTPALSIQNWISPYIYVLIHCVCICFCMFVCFSAALSVCKIKTAEGLCVCVFVSVHCWMNYPLPALRTWQTSNSNPCWILVSQSLPLRTLPWKRRDSLCNCVVCNGFFTEMTEWPLEQINTSLSAVSMIEMALYSNRIMFESENVSVCM